MAGEQPTLFLQQNSLARNCILILEDNDERVAGAIAIAIAAAIAWQLRGRAGEEATKEFFNEIQKRTPDGEVRRGIAHAFQIRHFEKAGGAARLLGNGSGITCPDTVPFTIWCAAKYLGRSAKLSPKQHLSVETSIPTAPLLVALWPCRATPNRFRKTG